MAKEKEMNIEDYFERLDEILENIDKKETSLKESFDLYKEGVKLVQNATETLTGIEKELIILEEGNDEGKDS
ncbi:MAG: exodeoxyribonuclease VII small subunit [Lachnospiraceae bacterium]|jgi:exodeoxyribonuclease VII small subunit|nr:exodeoxyribonuclease VII small subunit [Lachnospiraceae bacterium]MCR4778949.1 exodeoxyribonuclease VII small subunit [Lachnospiraceae bacterium]